MIIKDLIKEINHGKRIEKNLPAYFNEFMTLHNNVANYSFVFHYYTFIEMLQENDYTNLDDFNSCCDQLRACVTTAYEDGATISDLNDRMNSIDALRNHVIAKMKVLTAYTDVFQVYEYIMNRVEGRFETVSEVMNDDEFIAKLEKYIFMQQDQATVNAKIQEVIGQLPVRMTKSKFLELLKDSLSVYSKSDKSAVESFLYIVKSSGMLDYPEGYETEFPILVDYKKKFESVDFKTITKEEYLELQKVLEDAVDFLERTAQAFYTMQEVINDVYIILLTKPYANVPGTIERYQRDLSTCNTAIKALNTLDVSANQEMPNVVAECLTALVGKQESAIELMNLCESVFYDVEVNHSALIESMMLTTISNRLACATKLRSNSIFVELDREAVQGVADDVYMKRTEKALIKEFDELLSSKSQIVMRAIMGSVLSRLPIFFQNKDQVVSYIQNSITACKDEAEKAACMQLIEEIME